jgi:hypothetical protein
MAIQIASLFASIGADTSGLQRGLKDAETQISKTAQGIEKSGESFNFAAMATGFNQALEIVNKLGDAISKAYAAAKEGAAMEYAAVKFDNLSRSIGTTSDLLLGDLKSATRGMMSDAQLMGSAGDLMALGLAKSHDEAVRLTNVAGALGMNMNQLVLTLTNQTTMRFDALGVSVDGFKEKVKGLEDAGMSANDAFKEAFLQQAEDQIARVGSIAETSAGKLMMMESAFTNLGDALKLQLATTFAEFAPVITELGDSMTENIRVGQDYKDTMNAIQNLMKTGLVTGTQYKELLREMGVHSGMGAITAEQHQIALDFLNKTMDSAGESAQGWADANDRVYESMNNVSEATDYIGTSVPEAMRLAGLAVEDFQSRLADAQFNLSVAVQTFYESVGDNLVEGLRDAGLKGDDLISRLEILDGLMGTNYTLEYKIELATGDLLDQLINDPDGFAEAFAIFDEEYTFQIAGIAEAQAEVDTLQGALDDLEKEYNVWVNIHTRGSIPSFGGGGGGGGGGGSGVPQFAHAMGGYELAGQPYLVGEAGPELFIPDTNGRIIPNNELSDYATGAVINNYNLTMPTTARAEDVRMAFELMEAWNR